MLFSPAEKLPCLTCTVCGGTGKEGTRLCPECKGMLYGVFAGEQFFYWGERYTEYDVRLRRGRRGLAVFRTIGAVIFILGLVALFFFLRYERGGIEQVLSLKFWFSEATVSAPERALIWTAALVFLYLWYRAIVARTPKPEILYHSGEEDISFAATPSAHTWRSVHTLKRGMRRDISVFFTDELREVCERSIALAREYGHSQVAPMHVFHALLSIPSMSMMMVRLGISAKNVQGMIVGSFGERKKSTTSSSPVFDSSVLNSIFRSYQRTRSLRDPHIRVTALCATIVEESEQLQEMLYDLEVDKAKLDNMLAWIRMRDVLREKYQAFRRAAVGISKHGMDRAMTAIATPTLNQFSRDLTIAAKYGDLDTCVARDKEIDEIFRVIDGGGHNIILVGDHGVGKFTIIQGIVERMVEGIGPTVLHDKRLVQISSTSLLAGTTASGAQERLIRIMNEVSRAGNIILFINNIHDLMGVSDNGGQGLDVSESLAEYLRTGRFTMFATTLPDAYAKGIVNSEIGTVFSKVDIREMNVQQAIRVLESKAGMIEYRTKVFFSYDAVEKSAVLSDKFFYDRMLPESALSLMTEAASYARSKHGENTLVSADDVGAVVGEKTGIPATSITEHESDKLLRLEEEMHTQVIGQSEAVSLVANALRRARAEVRSGTRPIANFLFLGPTGVGKTELAKTIARVYFGGENRMVRIDMSEYQDTGSIYRLIGQPGVQGSGMLTEAVRTNPFSLVLLDEFEKADPNILNLFLQVFDDGRLTDSTGRVVDFTNAIIIATSNAGTSYIQKRTEEGIDIAEIREHLIRDELGKHYRPELLNRFDGIVLFKPLTRSEIKSVASLMLKRVAHDLEEKGVSLMIEDAALEALADVGFDPDFGARPMRRAIQDYVENGLATLILKGELKRRDTVVVGEKISLRVERRNS